MDAVGPTAACISSSSAIQEAHPSAETVPGTEGRPIMLKEWLLAGDVSVAYRVQNELLGAPPAVTAPLRERIATEGWGKQYLDHFDAGTGLWAGIYSPKWTSNHYTLLNLKSLGLDPAHPYYQTGLLRVLDDMWANKGKIRPYRYQDLCVVAMMLDMAAYGRLQDPRTAEMTDYILAHTFPDGGWNCQWHNGACHSSLHTTLSVLEAFRDALDAGYGYRSDEIRKAMAGGEEFILRKRFFRSERTGEVIHPVFLELHHPVGWHYDVLRALEYFASVRHPADPRMDEALAGVLAKQRADDTWSACSPYNGKVYFHMERTGQPSRWVTFRVLRILQIYRNDLFSAPHWT